MRIAIGSDHRGHAVCSKVIESIERLGHEVEDLGTHNADSVDYPDIASAVAGKVSNGQVERGILVGGTGLGMSVAANKFLRVRAAACHDELTAEMSRRHNDLNVLCLSADLLGEAMTDRMVEVWLNTPFDGGHHALLGFQAFGEQWDGNPDETQTTFHAALQLLGDSMNEARKLISGLQPPILNESGVVAAIDCLIREAEEREGQDVEFVHDVPFDRLASPLEIAIYRIVQEAVTNARQHSQSKKTLVELVQQDGRVHIQIQDWGIGFDPPQVEEYRYRFGLHGIRERARLLGGQAAVDTAPGKGTRITVELPLTSTIVSAKEET